MTSHKYERLLQHRLARRGLLTLAGSTGAGALLAACGARGTGLELESAGSESESPGNELESAGSESNPIVSLPDWAGESHGNAATPNYSVVFPSAQVNRMEIIVTKDDWDAMLANLTELLGERGTGGGQRGVPPGAGAGGRGAVPPDAGAGGRGAVPPGAGAGGQGAVPPGAGAGGQGAIPGKLDLTPENPMWVSATILFEGKSWTHVGVRFKGNSSLRSAWDSGTDKIPFKLDFDEWEADHAEIRNQRFYGFKQLSLSNNHSDSTGFSESLVYEMLEESGLVAAKTAPYEIVLNNGYGTKSLGLYTVIEVVDDTVVRRSFADASGNIYEANGPGASLAADVSAQQIETSFEVEGGVNPDWSDIKKLHEMLHSELRIQDTDRWREELEASFDVPAFLRWLGITAAVQHWDSYGTTSHNYYLYHDPGGGQLHWISWDHNETFSNRPATTRQSLSLDWGDTGPEWPLIRYLLDQPAYYEQYLGYLKEFLEGPFDFDKLAASIDARAELVEPVVSVETSPEVFEAGVRALAQAARDRVDALTYFLAT